MRSFNEQVQIAQNLLNVIRLAPHYISKLDARYNVGWIILQNIYIKETFKCY